MSEATAHHEEHHGVGHIVDWRVLIGVLVSLLILTWLTVKVTEFDLGSLNIVIALGIATLKASLVCLFFMHLYYDQPFNSIILVSSLLFVLIFILFSLLDLSAYQSSIIPDYISSLRDPAYPLDQLK
ncbi:MAG: cytochrome C oxidase subunit IV family protein [Candidatus Omnitrophica bacterium]|nr:cytochrome C oxidase subunit IV family protein [Candidatus Omnitrophota bacterium]MCA9436070.1 cytochrome C oxidase subunit IV family protein [Candidatus Omnitrophota bacterium]